jgi:hypothetical protein
MTLVSEDYDPSTGFFAKPLFRSGAFLMATFIMVVAVTFDFQIIAGHSSQIGRHVVFWLLLIMVGLVGFWVRSILIHKDIRRLYQRGAILDARDNSPLDAVIRVAENMFYLSLYFTFFLSGALLAQILAILPQN